MDLTGKNNRSQQQEVGMHCSGNEVLPSILSGPLHHLLSGLRWQCPWQGDTTDERIPQEGVQAAGWAGEAQSWLW